MIISNLLFTGKRVGVVTTARLTHATPAASYAHANRRWECGFPKNRVTNLNDQCKDIARQLLEDNDINVRAFRYGSTSLPSNTNAPIWSMSIELHGKFLLGRLLLSKGIIDQFPVSWDKNYLLVSDIIPISGL